MNCNNDQCAEEDIMFQEKFSEYLVRRILKSSSRENSMTHEALVSVRRSSQDYRVLLEPEDAKLLIDKAAEILGSYTALARRINVSRRTLKQYRDGKTTLPKTVYETLQRITNIHVKAKRILPHNWGQSKGWRARISKKREEKCQRRIMELTNKLLMEKSEELSEFVSRMLGDGSISRRNPCYYSSDLRAHERMSYLVKELFGYEPVPKPRSNYYRMNLRTIATHVLNALGIPTGKKSITNPHFPSFIFDSENNMKAALRGFISDEGYCVGNFVYVDIAVRIPDESVNLFKNIDPRRDYSAFLQLVESLSLRSNLLDDISKMLTNLHVSHVLYPQKIARGKSAWSIVWRIKISKSDLIEKGIKPDFE